MASAGRPSCRQRIFECCVELVVGVLWVVVKEEYAGSFAAVREPNRVRDRRVTPAEVTRVLRVRVLAVVNEQIGVAGQ
jgi:hypothetical protein